MGDYFRYDTCHVDWKKCTPIELDFWVQNKTSSGHGYNLEMLAVDGSNIQKGVVTIGTLTPDPVYSDPNISNYSTVYKNTIISLDTLATSDSPKDFSYPTWSKLGMPGIHGIGPMDQEQVTVQAGSYKAWVIGWLLGVYDNLHIKIWVVPSMPFPVKGVYTDTQEKSPLQFNFELLETGNNQTQPAFLNSALQLGAAPNVGPLRSSYPENKTMQLSLNYEQAGSTADNTEGYMHLRFFDANTNNPIKKTSFFLNVTKGNQQLLYNLFYTYSGNFTLKLQPGGSDQLWHALPDHDPIFIGGLESSQDQLNFNAPIPSKRDLYHFEIEPVIFDESRAIYDQPSGMKFVTDFNFEQNYNSTVLPNRIPEFPLVIPILLISISSMIVFYRMKFRK